MKIENKKASTLDTTSLELVSPPRMTPVIVAAEAYSVCLHEFKAMAASDGARFQCQLGSCELAFSLHRDCANIVLLRNSREDVGKARLVWSEPHLNSLRVTAALHSHPLTGKNIPCLVVELAEGFRSKAAANEVQMAVHALAASALGLLLHLAKAPAPASYEAILTIPSTNVSSRLFGPQKPGIEPKKLRRI